MPAAIRIRSDYDGEAVRGLAKRCKDARQSRRLLALAAIYDWLSADQMRALAQIVETGPDPERDGVVRWRRIDLKQVIEERFGIVYAERSISKLLADLDFVHMSARPQHPKQDAKVIAAYKKTSPARLRHT